MPRRSTILTALVALVAGVAAFLIARSVGSDDGDDRSVVATRTADEGRITAAQFDAIELRMPRDEVLRRLGPGVGPRPDVLLGDKPRPRCLYYRPGTGLEGNHALRICFAKDATVNSAAAY